ncbi:AI-2E family transporter [Clostridium sp. CF011]|uniref:AI-2E family transporter n=1 Tax=Clostridium TaxID=1485 RepID=UPI0013EEC27B|nr:MULTISPECIES: AI-2E family transporter [Clostridium]MBU3091930.1 AI-2E family transporter [Clostridium sp. CF011]MBW9145699.1 AI-2E family transporter [Clostridium sp. CM027]MBZ9608083.1 AI-2E family transporter [Clostridium estertheticum]UVE41451.1 AI-2E family transporter [Clostridium sp. CM027]WAG70445.1 AI-2E family transporter [Clostridium sp. CF011]
MKKISKKKLAITILSIIIFVVVLFMLIKIPIVKQLINLVFISFIVAYILKPLYMLLIRKGVNKKASACLIIVGLLSLVLLTFIVVIPSIFRESLDINKAINDLQKYLINANMKIKVLNRSRVMSSIMTTIYQKSNAQILLIFDKILDSIMGIGENILTYMVSPLIVYYFLCDSENMINKALIVFPPESRNIIKRIIADIDKVLGRYIISQFILCGIITIATFLILMFMKVDFPLILSLINGIFNIIPYFGPIFGVIPIILIALLDSPKIALYTALWLFALQQIEGSILSPKIIGDSISMHPLTVILLLVIGGKVGGILGMILAVPLGVVIKVIYEDLNYYLF